MAGWDAAGTVVAGGRGRLRPARSGARVVTFGWSGAWAQRRAVDTGELAVLPDAVDFAAAAALPVAARDRAARGAPARIGARAQES